MPSPNVSDPSIASIPTSVQPSLLRHTKKFNFAAAICVIVKDAEAHLEEFLDYHLLALNFQNIYVYDNSAKQDLAGWYQNSREDPVYKRVEVHYKTGRLSVQQEAYADCITQYGLGGPKHDYFALIDVDEFFVIQNDNYTEIRDVLQDYLVPFGGALVVNWMFVGSSNRTVYAPMPVTKRFQYRYSEPHPVIKSIVQTSDFEYSTNPHGSKLKNGIRVRNTVFPGSIQKLSRTGASDAARPSNVILLYHYRFLSQKEYIGKRCDRGNLQSAWCDKKQREIKSDARDHVFPQPGEVFDDKPWRLLKAAAPKYRMYDNFVDYT